MALAGRRVVVTGLGLVTPLGVGTSHAWSNFIAGKSATSSLTDPIYSQLPCRVAAQVPEGGEPGSLDLSMFSSSDLRSMTRSIIFGLVAAKEAVKDAGWEPKESHQLERTGVAVGTGMVDLDDILETGAALAQRYSKVSPFFVPRILSNMIAGRISMTYGFQGPNHAVSTACATGAHAIGDAMRFIKHGDADVMICGAAEASISPLGIGGFSRLRALATKFNETPEEASRPFDKAREGFVMGEGAGIVVLEELQHALNRGVTIKGEVLGYGCTGDAHHMTAPREDGRGAERAMARALQEANVSTNHVGYINAHATSTPLGDAIEVSAIQRLFAENLDNILVSSTKGAVGHLLGAAGAVEAIVTLLSCKEGVVPPTVNLQNASPEFDALKLVSVSNGGAINWSPQGVEPRRVALTNSFGFGGTNAALCLASYSG